MKKLTALLLALIMLFSFTACNKKIPRDNVRGEQTENTISSNEEENSATASEEFSAGDTEGLTYENKFIGLGCRLDSNWSFYSDEQIKELNNIATDLAGEEYEKALENADLVYDMYAINSNQTDSINVILEKVSSLQLAALDITENFETIFPTIKQSLENMGYTNVTYEIGSIRIDDREFANLNTVAEINGIKMYQSTIAVKCGGYLANIAVTTFNDNLTASIFDKFYVVK